MSIAQDRVTARITVLPNADALAEAAADAFVVGARAAIDARGRFVVALSGGSTPRLAFEKLAAMPRRALVDWERVHVVWGDERCVPPDHADSNYRMASEVLLARVPVRAEHIHRMHGEYEPQAAAAEYEQLLRTLFETPRGAPSLESAKRIDLTFLGLGDDGHTASLFPHSTALGENARWATAVRVEKLAAWRVTLTYAMLNASAKVMFLVAGNGKAGIAREVLHGAYRPLDLPAQAIGPASGAFEWLLDAPAGALLGSA